MMHNLRRRVEALEQIHLKYCKDQIEISQEAMKRVSFRNAELFIRAILAERDGRELTAEESDVMQEFRKTLTIECRWAGYASSEDFERVDFGFIMMYGCFSRFSGDDIGALCRDYRAQEEGQAPSPDVAALVQAWDAEMLQLSIIAGVPTQKWGPAERGPQ